MCTPWGGSVGLSRSWTEAWDGQRAWFGHCPCALVSPLSPGSCSLSPVLGIEHPWGWQPKSWCGRREMPWLGVTLGQLWWPWHPPAAPRTQAMAMSQLCLPTLAVCRMSRHKLWGFLRKQEEDEPCQPPEALFVLCGSSNGLEIAASMAETSSATQLCAECTGAG